MHFAIQECVRFDGVTALTIPGHGLTAEYEGKLITVSGVPVRDANGVFHISKVMPDVIEYEQPDSLRIPAGVTGGTAEVFELTQDDLIAKIKGMLERKEIGHRKAVEMLRHIGAWDEARDLKE